MNIAPNSYREVLAMARAQRRVNRERIITATLLLAMAAALGAYQVLTSLPACPTEDSAWCTWDAAASGNGQGRSFVALWQDGPVWRFNR